MKYTNSEMQIAIDEVVHSERDRQILRQKYIDGKTYEIIAENMDLSSRAVANIIQRHLHDIQLYLSKEYTLSI